MYCKCKYCIVNVNTAPLRNNRMSFAEKVYRRFLQDHNDNKDAKSFGFYLGVESKYAKSTIQTILFVLRRQGIFTARERREAFLSMKLGLQQFHTLYGEHKP